MKKIVLLLLALLTLTCQISMAKVAIHLNISIRDDNKGNIKRTPMQLSLEAYYDDETNQVEVSGDFYGSVEVYLCDESLDVLDYSTVLNTTLDVPADYHGLIVVRIACDDWVAVGKTEI